MRTSAGNRAERQVPGSLHLLAEYAEHTLQPLKNIGLITTEQNMFSMESLPDDRRRIIV